MHKILIVDDEVRFLQLLMEFLTAEGYEVFSATNGVEAIKQLKKNAPISVIFADQKMPIMKGTDFLDAAKDISPDSVRVMLTAFHDIELMQEAINKGEIFRFLTKPINITEVLNITRLAINLYESKLKNLKKHKILFINKKAKFLHLMKQRFSEYGYAVLIATSTEESIEIVNKSGPISVAVIYGGPYIDVIRFFEGMKKKSPRTVSILFASSKDYNVWGEYVNKFNVFRVLTKLQDRNSLEESIISAIRKYDQDLGKALLSIGFH